MKDLRLQASTLAKKFDISHWFPWGADGQAYGHVITGWIDYQIFLGARLRSRARGAWRVRVLCRDSDQD